MIERDVGKYIGVPVVRMNGEEECAVFEGVRVSCCVPSFANCC